MVTNLPGNAGDMDSIPGSGKSPGGRSIRVLGVTIVKHMGFLDLVMDEPSVSTATPHPSLE